MGYFLMEQENTTFYSEVHVGRGYQYAYKVVFETFSKTA